MTSVAVAYERMRGASYCTWIGARWPTHAMSWGSVCQNNLAHVVWCSGRRVDLHHQFETARKQPEVASEGPPCQAEGRWSPRQWVLHAGLGLAALQSCLSILPVLCIQVWAQSTQEMWRIDMSCLDAPRGREVKRQVVLWRNNCEHLADAHLVVLKTSWYSQALQKLPV